MSRRQGNDATGAMLHYRNSPQSYTSGCMPTIFGLDNVKKMNGFQVLKHLRTGYQIERVSFKSQRCDEDSQRRQFRVDVLKQDQPGRNVTDDR